MATRTEFKQKLRELVEAAVELDREWDTLSAEDSDAVSNGYPAGLPSFDEFVSRLITWRDSL